MLPDTKSAAIDAQPAGDLGGIEGMDIQHSQQVPIFRAHRLERDADLFAAVPIDQSGQRIGFLTRDQGLRASETAKRARLAMRAAAMVQTDVARSLKDKGGKRIEILHAFIAQRFQNPADCLLSDVFRDVAIAQAAGRKYAQSQPEAFGQLRGKCIGRSIGAGGQSINSLA
jgi:hypothetical protein